MNQSIGAPSANHPARIFSKSKLLAYRQCPKRLWLEIHKPELRDDSGSAAAFQIGHQVGDVARGIYDASGSGALLDVDDLGYEMAFARSAMLLQRGEAPVFEAGMKAAGALAFADVMLPDLRDGALSWKMVEIKSSTGVKDYHRDPDAGQDLSGMRFVPRGEPGGKMSCHEKARKTTKRKLEDGTGNRQMIHFRIFRVFRGLPSSSSFIFVVSRGFFWPSPVLFSSA